MKKNVEKEIFDQVYFDCFKDDVVESERPDFLIRGKEGNSLGVEITEVYRDCTDARLTHHEGYMGNLLDKVIPPYKSDQKNIHVDEIQIIDSTGNEKARVNAVIIEALPLKDSVKLVEMSIQEKNIKAADYLTKCDMVDLIVHDSSMLLTVDSFESFHKVFFPNIAKEVISNSPFREIYILVSFAKGEKSYIPLKINLFLSDFFALNECVRKHDLSEYDDEESWDIVFRCMYLLGHHSFSYIFGEDMLSLFHGAWSFEVKEEGNNLKDYSNWLCKFDKGTPINEENKNIYVVEKDLCEKLVFERAFVSSIIPIFFKARGITKCSS